MSYDESDFESSVSAKSESARSSAHSEISRTSHSSRKSSGPPSHEVASPQVEVEAAQFKAASKIQELINSNNELRAKIEKMKRQLRKKASKAPRRVTVPSSASKSKAVAALKVADDEHQALARKVREAEHIAQVRRDCETKTAQVKTLRMRNNELKKIIRQNSRKLGVVETGDAAKIALLDHQRKEKASFCQVLDRARKDGAEVRIECEKLRQKISALEAADPCPAIKVTELTTIQDVRLKIKQKHESIEHLTQRIRVIRSMAGDETPESKLASALRSSVARLRATLAINFSESHVTIQRPARRATRETDTKSAPCGEEEHDEYDDDFYSMTSLRDQSPQKPTRSQTWLPATPGSLVEKAPVASAVATDSTTSSASARGDSPPRSQVDAPPWESPPQERKTGEKSATRDDPSPKAGFSSPQSAEDVPPWARASPVGSPLKKEEAQECSSKPAVSATPLWASPSPAHTSKDSPAWANSSSPLQASKDVPPWASPNSPPAPKSSAAVKLVESVSPAEPSWLD